MTENGKKENTVKVVGYLKENNLECATDKNGSQVIRGSVTIATSESSSYKISYYVAEEKNKEKYDSLVKMLPENTVSIKDYLAANPTANYATAANGSTKLWAIAKMEEFVSSTDNKEYSRIQFNGTKIGFKTATDSAGFVTEAKFKCDVFINSLTEESVDGKKTGRILLEGLIPAFPDNMYKVTFVAPVEDSIAAYVDRTYAVNDTVTLKGNLIRTRMVTKINNPNSGDFFGEEEKDRYETHFTSEQVITGGSKVPIHQGEDGCITLKEVKSGLSTRENKALDAGVKRAAKMANPAPKTPTMNDDIDF